MQAVAPGPQQQVVSALQHTAHSAAMAAQVLKAARHTADADYEEGLRQQYYPNQIPPPASPTDYSAPNAGKSPARSSNPALSSSPGYSTNPATSSPNYSANPAASSPGYSAHPGTSPGYSANPATSPEYLGSAAAVTSPSRDFTGDGDEEEEEEERSCGSSRRRKYSREYNQYGESASPSNSGEEEDEREFDGKRAGAPLNGFASKKRRKQSKPIRLGGEGISGNGGGDEEMEEGEVRQHPIFGYPEATAEEDTPLNLSSGGSSSTSGGGGIGPVKQEELMLASGSGLRVLGRELLQNPDKHVQQQQLSHQQEGIIFTDQQQPFTLPPHHFMFPFSGLSGGSSMNEAGGEAGFTPASGSGGRMQIFNIEAYCKLCNKEFCNKYFLKTHMANKHGIYSDSSQLPSVASMSSNNNNSNSAPSSMSIGPPPPGLFDRRMPLLGNMMLGNSSHQQSSPPVSISGSFMATMSSSAASLRMPAAGTGNDARQRDCTPPSPQHQLASNNTSFDHRSPLPSPLQQRPSSHPADRSSVGLAPPPPLISSHADEDRGGNQSLEDGEMIRARHGENRHQQPDTKEETDDEDEEEGSVQRHNPDHRQQQLHHRTADDTLGSCSPGANSLQMMPLVPPVNPFGSLPFFGLNHLSGGALDLMRGKDDDLHHHLSNHHHHQQQQHRKERGSPGSGRAGGKSSGQGGGGSRGMTPDKLRQMGVINADAFCEFCCKEFCNKYFLRVHKLKKHGVCSPELPPEKVQKILQQMAKEAGKTGQPMPPLTLGAPSVLGGPPPHRPSPPQSDPPKSIGGGGGGPLGSSPLSLIRPPTLPNFLSLPPLDPLLPRQLGSRDPDTYSSSSSSSDRADEREEGRPINLQFSPRSLVLEPDCELRVEENSCGVAPKSMTSSGEREEEEGEREEGRGGYSVEQSEAEMHRLQQQQHREEVMEGEEETKEPSNNSSEGLANLQNMIMKLNSSKPPPTPPTSSAAARAAAAQESNTVCKVCNRDMENKYFLHAHMMNEHGMLNMEEEGDNSNCSRIQQTNLAAAAAAAASPQPPVSVSLPQYPADLSKLAESGFRLSGLNIPCPLISSPSPVSSLAKLSEKPPDFPKLSLFDQLQGLPRTHPASFLDQMKRDLGVVAKMDLQGLGNNSSPLKRPSMDQQRDPNKKPASLSRSYCEICKKELCNKYFMKTHMMKMHGIVMDQTPGTGDRGGGGQGGNGSNGGNVNCEVCKKEVSSRYFLKVHMASAHGLNEDGTPLREMGGGGLMNLFPSLSDFPPLPPPPPPHMGEFSRLLMQQGEKSSLEARLKELDRINKEQQGHICSLCSRTFSDIVSLQVHIIKSHGALPPSHTRDNIFQHLPNNNRKEEEEEGEQQSNNNNNNNTDDATAAVGEVDDDIAEPDVMAAAADQPPSFPFPEKLELLQRQLAVGSSMLAPASLLLGGLPGFGAAGPQQQHQFQGLFNMFLSEMLKKVQKDTPPQTPPVSPTADIAATSSTPPPPQPEPLPSAEEAATVVAAQPQRLAETTTST